MVGFAWALTFNAVDGTQLGVFYYRCVIGGPGDLEGTRSQYPLCGRVGDGVIEDGFRLLLEDGPGRPDDH